MNPLSREHQAIANQKAAFAQLRPVVEDEEAIALLRFYDCFDGAVSCFILSELHMRQGERCRALKVFPDLEAHSMRQGAEQNLKALGHLANAQAFLWKFRINLMPDGTIQKTFSHRLDDFRHEVREVISQFEIRAGDAAALSKLVDEVCAVFRSGATELELFGFIDAALASLEALRKTPARGAEPGMAAWKLLVAQVLTALAAWSTWKCFHATCRCAQTEKAVHASMLAVAAVVSAA